MNNAYAGGIFCSEEIYDGSEVDCGDDSVYDSSLATDGGKYTTGFGYNVGPRLRECCRQGQAEVVQQEQSSLNLGTAF